MARGANRRTWVKLYCDGVLNGSIAYQLEEAEQAVWMKLLAFAGVINRDGQISDNDGRPFPRGFIMHRINTTAENLESTLKKCIEEGRIKEDEQGLHITNWKVYQSEYNRQKPYREKQKRGKYHDTNIGSIRIGRKEFWVKMEEDGGLYYLNDRGEKVTVHFDDKTEKYVPD